MKKSMIVLLLLGNVALGQISLKQQVPSQNLMILPQDPVAVFHEANDTAIDFSPGIIQLKSGKPALFGAILLLVALYLTCRQIICLVW